MSDINEYLRRNLLVAKAIGARSYIPGARDRLLKQKRPPKWLLRVLDGMDERLEALPRELAKHRDEVSPVGHVSEVEEV